MNKTGGVDHYKVQGELTFATVAAWLPLPEKWTPGGGGPITVDLREVSKADSAGLALLIEWRRRAHTLGRTLAILNIPPRLKDLIRVSGLSALFPDKKAT